MLLKCHTTFVPALVELSVAGPQQRKFRRVGSVKFVSGGGGGTGAPVYVADLQTLRLDEEAAFLRLSIPAPYMHTKNFCNQVGLVSVALEGSIHLEKSTHLLQAGQQGLDFQLLLQGIDIEEDFVHSEAQAAGLDTAAGRMIRDVRRLKADYQAREEYDEAQRLSILEHKMADAGVRILDLQAQKQAAVVGEDYATAKRCKSEMDELNRLLEACMLEARQRQLRRGGQHQEIEDGDVVAAQRRMAVLEGEKAEAVRIENYSAAKALKEEIEKLRAFVAARDPSLPEARIFKARHPLEGQQAVGD